MSPACRPQRRARTSPTPPRPTRPAWRACAPPARSRSARPISTSSRPAWSGCARPTACRAMCSTRNSYPADRARGSGVAVAAGLVPFSLGTDTAGSGRVPAGLGNIVGLKPSLGMVSTAGVVPACRTLDCVSVFALTVDDAWAAFAAMAGPDIADPYTRNRPVGVPGPVPNAAHRRADQGRARVLRRSGVGRAVRGRDRALRSARRDDRGNRHRAVLRDRAAALRGPVGRRALSRRAQADRVVTRVDASGDARDHARRRAPERGRRLRGVLQARRPAPRARSHLPPDRRAAGADHRRPPTRSSRCWPIRSSSTAGSAPTPISSTCSISPASRCRRA